MFYSIFKMYFPYFYPTINWNAFELTILNFTILKPKALSIQMPNDYFSEWNLNVNWRLAIVL